MTAILDSWEKYAAGTEANHFAWWCEHYLTQWVDQWEGQPLILEPWEVKFMSEALAVDENEFYVWSSVCLVVARKNGKTAMLAAYALYRLLNDRGHPEILLTAASDKQAGRLFDACVHFCRNNPELLGLVHLREYVGEISRIDGGGKIMRMPSDPSSLHGYEPSLVICDELHAWTKPTQRKAWAALTTGGGSRKQTQVFVITTAGSAHERHDSILGRLIDGNETRGEVEKEAALTISRNFIAETLVYNYSAPTLDPRDTKAMKLANPASWITDAYLLRQAMNPELDDSEVLQLHGCVWAPSEKMWLDSKLFEACAVQGRVVTQEEMVVVAFDGSYSRDASALVGCTLDGYLFLINLWERPQGVSDDWKVPISEVNAAVDDALDYYNVVEFAPDPPGYRTEIDVWEETYGEIVVRFETNQRARMAPACDRFRTGVFARVEQIERDAAPEQALVADLAAGASGDPEHGQDVPMLSYDGNTDLARHVAHCQKKETTSGIIVQKDAPDSPRKIDAAVAAIVAYDRAVWHAANQPEDGEPMWAWV